MAVVRAAFMFLFWVGVVVWVTVGESESQQAVDKSGVVMFGSAGNAGRAFYEGLNDAVADDPAPTGP
jgi:hypothetical protein